VEAVDNLDSNHKVDSLLVKAIQHSNRRCNNLHNKYNNSKRLKVGKAVNNHKVSQVKVTLLKASLKILMHLLEAIYLLRVWLRV
jgi:hypothetical protein